MAKFVLSKSENELVAVDMLHSVDHSVVIRLNRIAVLKIAEGGVHFLPLLEEEAGKLGRCKINIVKSIEDQYFVASEHYIE